jgi:hypothetical protein
MNPKKSSTESKDNSNVEEENSSQETVIKILILGAEAVVAGLCYALGSALMGKALQPKAVNNVVPLRRVS